MPDEAHERYDIAIQLQTGKLDSAVLPRITQAITWVLDHETVADGTGLSVVIAGDEEVQRLNRTFRGMDKPTDVLSFPADPVPEGESPYLGDLVLSLPYIQWQAANEQHDWPDEIVLAVIHGTLHLLGYDHDTPENQARMWAVQAAALRAMDVAITVPLFTFDEDDQPGEPAPDLDEGES